MNLLEKLTQQIAEGKIKPGACMAEWLDTLGDDELDELERLVTLLEEEPEQEDTVLLGEIVVALHTLELADIDVQDQQLVLPEMEEDEFFKLLNSFLFLLPFYYWAQQELIEITPKLSLVANSKNEISVRITEYGKGQSN